MESGPTDEEAVASSTNAASRRVPLVLAGAAAGCLSLFFVINAMPSASFARLGVLLSASAIVAQHRFGRTVVKAGLATVAVLSAVVIFSPVVDWSVDWLDVSRRPGAADVIVVLGAGLHCGSGDLDSTSVARITKGVALLEQGIAPEMTISGNDRAKFSECPSQGAVTLSLIESLGGDTDKITTLRGMVNTRSEAQAIARLRKGRGWDRVLVVTSPTHTRRARDTFRDEGIEAVVVAADEPNFDLRFYRPADRMNAVAPVVREFAGLIKYRLTS